MIIPISRQQRADLLRKDHVAIKQVNFLYRIHSYKASFAIHIYIIHKIFFLQIYFSFFIAK